MQQQTEGPGILVIINHLHFILEQKMHTELFPRLLVILG